jgi:ABC-type proline/glycine betaine transport system permease subunit
VEVVQTSVAEGSVNPATVREPHLMPLSNGLGLTGTQLMVLVVELNTIFAIQYLATVVVVTVSVDPIGCDVGQGGTCCFVFNDNSALESRTQANSRMRYSQPRYGLCK